ncbi:hypothetical protein MADA3029_1070168 [Vibrio nigripulchritudo MADA3029]|nr:hypothetical protein MADA3029_1070168 [Vibrio nigripulchritudo MADA3029]
MALLLETDWLLVQPTECYYEFKDRREDIVWMVLLYAIRVLKQQISDFPHRLIRYCRF